MLDLGKNIDAKIISNTFSWENSADIWLPMKTNCQINVASINQFSLAK